MTTGTVRTLTRNPPAGASPQWCVAQLREFAPGSLWVVPRSITSVFIINRDPDMLAARSVFPDPRLIQLLRDAGWQVREDHVHK